jgi:hypothetical protein
VHSISRTLDDRSASATAARSATHDATSDEGASRMALSSACAIAIAVG